MDTSAVENLVLEGGGMKGIAFCGAIKYLEEIDIIRGIKGVIGSSAGSLYATLIACKASSADCRKIIENANFKSFRDDNSYWRFITNIWRLTSPSARYGWCKGDAIYEWYGSILSDLTGSPSITFRELYEKTSVDLVITGTNITKNRTEYFSHATQPSMEVRVALRISTCIPFLFPAVVYNGDLYVDGGLLNNYPIWYFDERDRNTGPEFLRSDRGVFADTRFGGLNSLSSSSTYSISPTQGIKTLGLKLMSSNEIVLSDGELDVQTQPISSVKEYGMAIIDSMLIQIERSTIQNDYWRRTVIIPTGDVSSIDFSLGKEKIGWLINSGYRACKDRIMR